MKAADRVLEDWFAKISFGQVELPRFQRAEAWGPREVTDLLQTVIEDLPAGVALILQVGDAPPFRHRPLETAPDRTARINELLLDGQQRLTALWRSLHGTYEDRTYFLDISEGSEDGESQKPQIVSERRYMHKGEEYPKWANNPNKTFKQRGYVPVRLLRPGNDGQNDLVQWLEEATAGDTNEKFNIFQKLTEYRNRVAQFNLPYLELGVDTGREVVLDVFVKMNTRSVPLSPFDIMVAECDAATEEDLNDYIASLNGQVPGLARYVDVPDLVLDAIALMQGYPPSKAKYFDIDWKKALEDWELLVEGAKHTVDLLKQERVPDKDRLPSKSPIAPLIALYAKVPETPDVRGNARTLLKKYLWRSFFTDRYEKSATTSIHQDYRELAKAVAGDNDAAPPIFKSDLPDADEILATGWPKNSDRLARSVLLLSLQGGALDIADGTELTHDNVRKREYHHLFPVAYLREVLNIKRNEANTALNCSLITWLTNRAIGAREPMRYLKERTEAASDEGQIKSRLASHAISFGDLSRGDYEEFKHNRAKVFEDAIRRLCAGERWKPPDY